MLKTIREDRNHPENWGAFYLLGLVNEVQTTNDLKKRTHSQDGLKESSSKRQQVLLV